MAAHINSPPQIALDWLKITLYYKLGDLFYQQKKSIWECGSIIRLEANKSDPTSRIRKKRRASSLGFTGLTCLGQRDFKLSPSVKIHLCTCAMCIKHRSLNYQETKSNTDTVLLRWRECKNGKSRISSGKFLSYESVVKARKGLGAIKHKVVQPAGRLLNPFPAFSRPLVFLLANLFPVSSFVHRSVRVDGALKAGSGRR